MENWREIFASYPGKPEPKDYSKAIRNAELILNEDLADFETEWLSQTLLFKPIGLFNTITSKRNEETWSKPVGDSFKLITKIVEKHWNVIENYCDDIIKLCMLPLDVQARKEAILCLLSLVKQPTMEIEDEVVLRQVNALEEAKNCKAPLALLVGTICRYHPEKVQEHYNRIWRIYLNMLQPNNKTDTVVSSVLQGMDGLFHHFGNDLEIIQLNNFYDQMARECIKISKCLDVLLSILKHHANLFKEKLAGDRAIRLYIWQIEAKHAMEALSSIYETILPVVKDKEQIIRTEVLPKLNSPIVLKKHTSATIIMQSKIDSVHIPRQIIRTEVLPKLNSPIVLIKHTAATIIMQSKIDSVHIPRVCSGIDLEFLMRVKKLSYEEGHTVSWCIQSNIANSETMLLTAIMFYDNLPSSKKKDIVVNGILNANDEVRKAALTLLLKLSLQENLDKYIDIWRTLLNNRDGPDLSKAVVIFEEVALHLLELIESLVRSEKSYQELRPVFSLTSILFSLHRGEYYTRQWVQYITPALLHLEGLIHTNILHELTDIDIHTMMIREQFEEDTITAHLCNTMTTQDNEKLSTLQLIFTRETSELKLISKALKIFERIFNKDDPQMIMILNQIAKLKSKPVPDSKEARVFQKDIAMFLGKHSSYLPKESFSEDIYVLKLKNKLYLNIPNIIEGSVYKIDLLRILQICLKWAESETLYCMLAILCGNLCDRPDVSLQEVTIRLTYALLKSDLGATVAELGVHPALLMCVNTACVQSVIKCITQEPNEEVRRKLSECLEVLLTCDPGSENAGELLNLVAEQSVFMMKRNDDSTCLPFLDILRAFLSSLKDNNDLIIKHIPDILLNIVSKTELPIEIFEITTKIYIEKIDLFTENQIKELLTKIVRKLSENVKSDSCHCLQKWRTCEHLLNAEKYKKIVSFIKNVSNIKKFEETFLVNVILNLIHDTAEKSIEFFKILLILGYVVEILELDPEIRTKIVDFENGLILKQLSEIDITSSLENEREFSIQDLNGVLIFLKAFANELIQMDSEKTTQCIGRIIENISPKQFIALRKNITTCLSTYISLNQREKLIPYYEKWVEKSILTDITTKLENNTLISEYSDNYSDTIHFAKTVSELLEYPTEVAKNWTCYIIQNTTKSELKWSQIFLSDLLTVSEKCLKMSAFSDILSNNFDFVRKFVGVYFRRLVLKPFCLKEGQCMILMDLLDYFAKNFREEFCVDVLDLVNYLWPSFETQSSFEAKQSILLHIFTLFKDISLDSEPVKWAVTLLTSDGTSLEDRSKLIATLPAGEKYSSYYKSFASKLPVLLSEMQGAYVCTFRCLLDVLASNCDVTVFDIVCTLAGGDDTSGWWDYAIDACMKSLAEKQDMNIFNRAYEKTKSTVNLGVCNRVMMPLLRHSSRKFCEAFISSIAGDLFNTLKVGFREPSNTEAYRKRVTTYAIVFNIMKVAFEKIPSESLLSGNINACAGSTKPWYFTEQACIYCVTVSGKVACPVDANDELKKACLWLQCSSYNCLATAIIRRKPNKKLYARIFDVHAWEKLVDKDAVYSFELRSFDKYKGSKPTNRQSDAIFSSSSFTGTVRSKLFMTTLTENPLQYDLIEQQENEELEEDELPPDLEDHPLNIYGIIHTLSNVLHHIHETENSEFFSTVVQAISSPVHNVKYLLAKAICNSEDSLKPYAKDFIPALLKLIAESPATKNGKNVLHELHIEIIQTILKWSVEDIQKNWDLDKVIEYLIYTILEFKYRIGLHRRLLNILNSVLQLYGAMIHVKWDVFQEYCKEFPKDLTQLLPILKRLIKNKAYLPDLLPQIFSNPDPKNWGQASKLAEICGLALSLADGVSKETFLAKFWTILSGVRGGSANGYIKMLFYAQKHCGECCDLQQFKIITDLAPKIEKAKCLSIIASHLQNSTTFNEFYIDMFQIISLLELFDSDLCIEALRIAQYSLKYMEEDFKSKVLEAVSVNCKSTLGSVRREAFGVFMKAFEDLVKSTNPNSTKRNTLDSTPLLNTLNSSNAHDALVMVKIFEGIFDDDEEVGNIVSKGVEGCLSKDVGMRFAELFYLLIYQSNITNNKSVSLSVCGAKFLHLLLSELRSLDAFKCSRLREDGLPQHLLTTEILSKRTYTKTLLTSGVTFRRKSNKASQHRQMNIQMPITDIIDVLLRAAKTNTQICQELFLQIMKCLQGGGHRFDLDSCITIQLSHIMTRPCNSITPLVLDACRVFVNGVAKINGFKESVEKLKLSLFNTEGYLYTSILYEDLILRSGDRSQFIFSMIKEDTDTIMKDEEFTIEGLISVFGTLSNWDDLRIQDKKQLETSLPPLWVKEDDFLTSLREYFDGHDKKLDYNLWFNKLVASLYSEEVTEDRMTWLKQIDKWPKSEFVISSVIEAIQWHQSEGKITGEIDSKSCLAEWAGRLMVRSAMVTQCDILSQDTDVEYTWPSSVRGDELYWCIQANRRSLPSIVLQCVHRNQQRLTTNQEILSWIHEKAQAYRIIGLKENNFDMLRKALEAAKKQVNLAANDVPQTDKLIMQKLILQLNNDLGILSINQLDDIMQQINSKEPSYKEKQVLSDIYEIAMIFYNYQWTEHDEIIQNTIISKLIDVLNITLSHNMHKELNLSLSIIMDRLANYDITMSDVTAKSIVEMINRIYDKLDFFSVDILKKIISVLPTSVLNEEVLNKLNNNNIYTCKEYFQLICDPNYTLLMFCDALRRNVLEDTEYMNIFERMKSRMFEISWAGSDYQALNTLKNRLYALQDMYSIDAKARELKLIIDELKLKPQRSTLRLSQLSPQLCAPSTLEEKKTELQILLRLPANVFVVKFYEQISVFTDSIRRPCVLRCLLSNGTTRRFIVKTGEPMLKDAALQRSIAVLPIMNEKLQVPSYNVTPLSDDSAIIEYLEDHVRLRDLMEERHDINNVPLIRAPNDKLILAPSLALEQYNTLCDAVTPYILRSSIENNCSCIEEFIHKKRKFEDTLSSMTIINWIFGVGDRHLQNIMYNTRTGSVCGVDYASSFQYGVHELPPARLTANLLAVCDVKVLESRLQTMMSFLRDNQKLYEAFVKTSFYWLGPEFKELKPLTNILKGTTVSYEITRVALEESEKRYKYDIIALLDSVFEGFEAKEEYGVEKQISCLLQHCTEPRILSVTPQGWEAWL